MAASDKTYRKQTVLHVVFAVSSLAMLVTTVWMFWDDYNRPFKKEQRIFRDVEEQVSRRSALESAPDSDALSQAVTAEKDLARARTIHRIAKEKAEIELGKRRAVQFDLETRYANKKADFDSLMSFFNIEVDQHGPNSSAARDYVNEMAGIKASMDALKLDIENGQAMIDQAFANEYPVTVDGQEVKISPKDAEAQVSAAEDAHKKLTEEFDRFLKATAQKEWTWKDTFRELPVIDGFASPVKIQQYTLDELPIDYSFKFVTRYDRCTTCHLGLEKSNYDKSTLAKLTQDPSSDSELMARLDNAKKEVQERNAVISAYNKSSPSADRKDPLPLNADQLKPKKLDLSDSRIAMFAAHPRLDLFVDSNSPHPAEKFGCSMCHGGQGSATTFLDATHAPNDVLQQKRWTQEHNWASIHFWDYPMQPQRFMESSCLKCHHQVWDLYRDGSQIEAPTLVRGFNLVRELGCFGCHEIAGMKSGRWVGPDLRLEPDPPLESLSPEDRLKKLADPTNPPGTYRKVGPSLARIAEKSNETWARQWIKAPRDFRPDTRMPHYYMQANNTPDVLPEEQKKFPDAEINAIAHYIFSQSRSTLHEISERAKDTPDVIAADQKDVEELSAKVNDPAVPDADKKTAGEKLAAAKARVAARAMPRPATEVVSLPTAPADDKARTEQLERGRHLFSTRGCLACHQHDGVAADAKPEGRLPMPSLVSDSNFGPNLSRLVSKLGTTANQPQTSRAWLVQWLMNPTIHSARTMMPTLQLTVAEADDIAGWLMAQPSDWKGIDVDPAERETLKALARVYLQKSLTNAQLKSILDDERGFTAEQLATKPSDADERWLAGELTDDKLKMFVGRKAITNLGCFGCHTIPGFENSKPIGTGLNEWGKKDADRIAFEDAESFVAEKFHVVDVRRPLTDAEKKAGATGWEMKGDKRPYERFYADRLDHRHHTREGFLHLKLQEPRSYDYNRIRAWDDRARMPQFKYARVKQLPNESPEEFQLRWERDEAEAREAVMTFILGLVADPVPAKYVYAPTGDRAAEVKGRAVLEKFNCAGCHLVRPGIVDLRLTKEKFADHEEDKDGQKVPVMMSFRDSVLSRLEKRYQDYRSSDNDFGADFRFPEHNAWAGQLSKRPDRLRLRGIARPEGAFVTDDEASEFSPDGKFLIYRLVDALRFKNLLGEVRDIPGSTDVVVPRAAMLDMMEPFGGVFGNLLAKYLQGRDAQTYGGAANAKYSYAAGPPSLIREGEKAQPGWLYQFLLNPHQLRPLAVLRMPKFSLSDDEAMALVNYFTAVDRRTNPGIGLTGPYLTVPERDDSYLIARTHEYVQRLKQANAFDGRVKEMQPFWAQMLKDRAAEADSKVNATRAIVDNLKKKNESSEAAEKNLAALEQEARRLKQQLDAGDFKELQAQWETKEAYIVDAFKLITNPNLCTKCHQVGTMPVEQVQGPSLALSAERLRPEWTRRWVANPERMQHYKSVMPANFPANVKPNPFPESFIGSDAGYAEEEIRAIRDFLMVYPQVAEWPAIKLRSSQGTTGGK